MDKRALRAEYQAFRDALPETERMDKSRALCGHLAGLLKARRYRSVAAFCPFRSEPDLRPCFEAHGDVTFYFPRVASTHPPRLLWGAEPLEPGLWGLMEPTFAQHFTPPVDLVLVPGLAFDGRGYRLGYGRGFYDALLDRLDPRLPTVGVTFRSLLVPELPTEPHDLPVRGVLTEAGLSWFEAEGD